MKVVTFSAARRRFERKSDKRVCKLKPRERANLQATYGLVSGNLLLDYGELDAVERWCREAGSLHESERLSN